MITHKTILDHIARDLYMDLAAPVETVPDEAGKVVMHEGLMESYMKVRAEGGREFRIVVREA